MGIISQDMNEITIFLYWKVQECIPAQEKKLIMEPSVIQHDSDFLGDMHIIFK